VLLARAAHGFPVEQRGGELLDPALARASSPGEARLAVRNPIGSGKALAAVRPPSVPQACLVWAEPGQLEPTRRPESAPAVPAPLARLVTSFASGAWNAS
jgi:hypothetical protein